MKTTGIRISDGKNGILCVELPDILEEIDNGESFFWAIPFSETVFISQVKDFTVNLQDKIEQTKNGIRLTWDELNSFSEDIHQSIDLLVIASKDKDLLRSYDSDKQMYETCDIVIEMIDSSYWEVFSKDRALIDRLAKKFEDIEFLESDFKK